MILLCISIYCNANDFLRFTNPLVEAADNNNVERVKTLLQRGIDPNIRGRFGATALMRASFNGNEDIVKLLLEYGADPILQDVGGVNSAQMAKRSNHLDIIGLFDLKEDLLPNYHNVVDSVNSSYDPTLVETKINNSLLSQSGENELLCTDKDIQNEVDHSQYIAQLYEDFYSLDNTVNAKSYKYLNSGVYKVALASDKSILSNKSDKNFIKLTEAVEIAETMDTNLQSKRNYVIVGFTDSADMDSKINSRLINFYFKSKEFEKDYTQLIVQLSNNFSIHQGKKACARVMRRFHTLRCEVY